jgi:phage regulator Rha-like protein
MSNPQTTKSPVQSWRMAGLELTTHKGNQPMNMLALNANIAQTMTSREIAELTGKRHDHVMTDIRTMLESLNIQSTEFSGDYKDSKGRTYPCFNLPKRETLILVSGYSVAMRAKIIDRWQELEAQAAAPQNHAMPTQTIQARHGLVAGSNQHGYKPRLPPVQTSPTS